jgi:dTDP-4-amino-4,6-dideoxygalactose transaminase
MVADYTGAAFAVAYNSATSGLHGACFAAGLGAGDTVHTSPLTFMASANCARYVGARPALIDIDLDTWNIDTASVDSSIDALVAVHYAGLPVDLAALSHRPRVVIEDAAHALGAFTPDGPVGNCAHSDMTVFSFHPVKPITTAEGGMVTTNDPQLVERLRRFRSHGIDRTPHADAWFYDAVEVGYNYRLTDVQAALGSSQMTRIDAFIEKRNAIADRYRSLLADLPITLPPAAPVGSRHGHHLFPVLVPHRSVVFRRLREAGIGVQVHYVPVHHHSVSADIAIPAGGFPNSDQVYAGLISLPMFPDLTDAEQDTVVSTLAAILADLP